MPATSGGRESVGELAGDGAEVSDVCELVEAAAANVALPERQLLFEPLFLHRKLGEGSFGVVFEAEDLRDGGRLALKMLRASEVNALLRFKREFRLLQNLVHPNLVVLDELFGSPEGWFFSMEYVPGTDFVTYVRAAPPGAERMTRLRHAFAQLLDGLAALHDAGVVHRDVKPSNVLVTEVGRVVLIDFGLASVGVEPSDRVIVGTPAYMAPEQTASPHVGPSADVYSAGVMLRQALTGARPSETGALELGQATRGTHRDDQKSVAADLLELCERCMQNEPDARPTARQARSLLNVGEGPGATLPTWPRAAPFVGRRAELEALARALVGIEYGEPSRLIVTGPSGIGKTRLVRQFMLHPSMSQQGIRQPVLLEGRCHDHESIPFQALDGVVDALAQYLGDLSDPEVAALLPRRPALVARLFPALRRVRELDAAVIRDRGHVSDDPVETRQEAFAELSELFARVAMQQPTVVFLDDLQWADADGLQALAAILGASSPAPLLFIGTLRTGGCEGNALERLELMCGPELRQLALLPLSDDLARQLAPDYGLQFRHASDGHPGCRTDGSLGYGAECLTDERSAANCLTPACPTASDADVRARSRDRQDPGLRSR